MIHTLDNKTLMEHTKELVKRERHLCAKLIAYLAETDHRRLYANEGYSSMFKFMTEGLSYSEPAANRRLTAARLSKRFPQIITLLESGALHLTGANLLAPHLTDDNFTKLIDLCSHKSKAKIEEILVKKFNTQSSLQREVVRLVPSVKKASCQKSEPTRAELSFSESPAATQQAEPMIEPEVDVRLSLTLDKESYENLKRAQVIAGAENMADMLKQAIDFFLDHKDQNRKMAKEPKAKAPSLEKVDVQTAEPAPAEAKAIPTATKRFVFKRDGFQCTFCDPLTGRRCTETCRLEIDHIVPRALNGTNDPENLRLRCKCHNLLAARQVFGAEFMERKMKRAHHQPNITPPEYNSALQGSALRSQWLHSVR